MTSPAPTAGCHARTASAATATAMPRSAATPARMPISPPGCGLRTWQLNQSAGTRGPRLASCKPMDDTAQDGEPDPLIGASVGPYRVESVLGIGGGGPRPPAAVPPPRPAPP